MVLALLLLGSSLFSLGVLTHSQGAYFKRNIFEDEMRQLQDRYSSGTLTDSGDYIYESDEEEVTFPEDELPIEVDTKGKKKEEKKGKVHTAAFYRLPTYFIGNQIEEEKRGNSRTKCSVRCKEGSVDRRGYVRGGRSASAGKIVHTSQTKRTR